MTANQISYAKLQEDVRTHLANEEIGRRQATAAEDQAYYAGYNAETNRLNAQTNATNSLINESAVGAQWYGAQANAAYQQAMAEVQRNTLVENSRHNKVSEANDLTKARISSNTSKEVARIGAEANRYGTDVRSETDNTLNKRTITKEYVLGVADIIAKVASPIAKMALGGIAAPLH